MYVYVGVVRARHNLLTDGGTGRCRMVCRAREQTDTNTHRVHLPTLGLDGQVYVCMCMGRYSVWYVGSSPKVSVWCSCFYSWVVEVGVIWQCLSVRARVHLYINKNTNTPTLITWSNQCNLWSSDCSGWWKVSVNVRVGKSRFPPFLPITLTLPSTTLNITNSYISCFLCSHERASTSYLCLLYTSDRCRRRG